MLALAVTKRLPGFTLAVEWRGPAPLRAPFRPPGARENPQAPRRSGPRAPGGAAVGAGRAAAPPAPRRTGAHAPRVGQGGGSGHARPRGGVSARRPDRRVRERPRAPGGAEVGAALAADLRRGRAADRHP